MYNKIDKVVNEIIKTDIYKDYINKYNDLYQEDVLLLLSKHSIIQEDYLRMKEYSKYRDDQNLYSEYKEVKKELMNNKSVQQYYQSYYELNELLEKVSQIIFDNISNDLSFEYLSLRSKV